MARHGQKTTQPLTNDPAREAVHSLRGYSYQLLRSIDAWLDLDDNEILVLEGAEDLDRVGPTGAVVEQVKDTAKSGSITLRSRSVIEAIGNFWRHVERNPNVAVQFRYLTTSSIGEEKKAQLSLTARGLEAWERIRQDPSTEDSKQNAEVIRTFLANQAILPETLRKWLAGASREEFVAALVEPMEWVTGRPNIRDLRQSIEARLVELGETRSIGAADSISALGQLHLEAWTVATQPDRAPLRRGDLLRIFDAAATTAIPNSQLLNMLSALAGAPPPGTAITSGDRIIESAPRAPDRRYPRPQLESDIASKLQSGVVYLHGSTGTGKTFLAAAATQYQRNVGWINLRDLDAPAIKARLNTAAVLIASGPTRCTVILDDLNPGADPRSILPSLDHLRTALARLEGSILVTSSHPPLPRIALALGLGAEGLIEPPPFDEAEVAAYLIAEGCDPKEAANWSKILVASTSGHPQLVDARVGALKDRGFPAPSLAEFTASPPEVVDIRAEARRMVSSLPGDDRELLCRASLLAGRISRKRLMAIAGIKPAISDPGDVIDRLTGPWLERTDTADLRVSPLLKSMGVDSRGQSWAKSIHARIAWAYLAEPSLTASDVSNILLHSVVGRTAGPIVQIMPSILQAPDEIWEQIGEASGLFAHVGVGGAIASPFDRPIDTAAFRVLQLRIASQLGTEETDAVVSRALEEGRRPETEQNLGVKFFDFLFFWQLLNHASSGRSLRQLIEFARRFVELGKEVRDELSQLRQPENHADEDEAVWSNLVSVLKLAMIPAIPDVGKLVELFSILEEFDPDDRKLVLNGYAGDLEGASLALDRVWLSEVQCEPPDWLRLVAVLERAISLGNQNDVPSLAAAAAPLLLRVTDENLRDTAGALAAADRLIGDLGRQPRILAAKAKITWRSGQAVESLPLYDEALAHYPLSGPWLVDVLREAAMGAARAGNWKLCSTRFGGAVASLSGDEQTLRRVGLHFDHGLALHFAGQSSEAIRSFALAIDELIADGQERPPEPLLSARQLGSQAMKVVIEDLKGEFDGQDPAKFIGQCSSFDTLTWGDQRPAPLDLIVTLLVELDLLLGGELRVAQKFAPRLRQTLNVLAGVAAGQLLSELAIKTLAIEDIVSDTVRQLKFMAHGIAERAAGREDFDRLESLPSDDAIDAASAPFLTYRILASMVALQAVGRLSQLPFAKWHADLPRTSNFDQVRVTLNDAESLLAGETDWRPRVWGGNETWDAHFLAAFTGLTKGSLGPDDLIVCHGVAAQYLNQPVIGDLAVVPFSQMVTSAWLNLCDRPALLVTPRLTIPSIRAAVTGTGFGWPRVTGVLQAALTGVSSRASASLRTILGRLPK